MAVVGGASGSALHSLYLCAGQGAAGAGGADGAYRSPRAGSPWLRRFRKAGTGFASGWRRIRGNRRRRGYDHGFELSDHADWPALLRTIRECGARTVLTTHGRSDDLVRYLREHEGVEA